MNSNVKTAIFWVVLVCVAILLWTVVKQTNTRTVQDLSFTDFLKQVEAGRVKEVEIAGTEVHGKMEDTTPLHTVVPMGYDKVYDLLREKNVVVRIKESSSGTWITVVINAIPFVLLLAFWVFMMRQMQSGGNKALSFGKSRARMHSSQQKKVTFKDVAGVEEAKEELQEIIEFLREPQKFQKLGGRIPKGVLLIGPPGTGKTLLARAIAGEGNVPFFSISGSDFVEMFVGVGASRVRDLFEQGKKNAPCIIFIDEIDAVGRHRGAGLGGGHDEREQTLNQLLVEMDGFESNEGVILVAATNRPDVLDPALLRPGRFDRRVVVSLPDVKGREMILKVHTKKTPLSDDVDLSVIGRGTPGFAGADLANLVNEAALLAARQNRKVVTMADFELAKDKVMMGAERRSMILTEEDKKVTAYHEAGHALVAALIKEADPLHKVSIIPRGRALGITMQLPTGDVLNRTKAQMESRLTVCMAGRLGEWRYTHQLSTGARNDIEQATELARAMVCDYGMSRLGPISFGKKDEQIFLGREIAQHRDFSEATAIKIDEAVQEMVEDADKRAHSIIEEYGWALEQIVIALLERESIDGEEVKAILAGKPGKSAVAGEPQDEGHQEVLRPEVRRANPPLMDGPQTA
ncbi:ATP-dependent zinc metalloprotease FtsH [uncultured Paludibaculum sp.]|uniref:ATP-dependent zinc metalloprotease FtsH n=1 Tax=uncultured Paludibaculum sp. TaxID=1765020 RepID=UPI002AAC3881|nr:ATP-dependent zinc metalloprotease FtsH [uncultured Paludibaculum sp.]